MNQRNIEEKKANISFEEFNVEHCWTSVELSSEGIKENRQQQGGTILISFQILRTSFGKKCLTICKESLHFELGSLPYLAYFFQTLSSEGCLTSEYRFCFSNHCTIIFTAWGFSRNSSSVQIPIYLKRQKAFIWSNTAFWSSELKLVHGNFDEKAGRHWSKVVLM